MSCWLCIGNLLQQRDRQTGSPRCRIHPRTPRRPSRQTAHPPRNTITAFSYAERDTTRLPGRKMPQIRRGRCPRGIWSRKRHLFLRRTGYQPPSGQENAPNPARKVLQRHSGQKEGAESARNGIPPACRQLGKHKKRGRSKTGLLKLLAYLKLSLYDSTHWASVSASTAISTHVSVNFVNVAC